MSTKSAVLVVILFVLFGPAVYVLSRAQSLAAHFERINVGDSAQTVKRVMGAPQSEERVNLHLKAQVEYRYSVWPIPTVWVVGLTDGAVASC